MKCRSVIYSMVLCAALTCAAMPVCAAETQTVIADEETAKAENMEGLDTILQQAYQCFLANDADGIYQLDANEMTSNYVQMIRESGADRYICQISDDTYAMLYVPADSGYWWYFGQMQNGLRQGSGTTWVVADAAEYMKYTGSYSNDLPYGDGQIYGKSDWFEYSITGSFQGALLNGTYAVTMTDPDTGVVNSANFPYVNNHLQSFEDELAPDGTYYTYYEPNHVANHAYADGTNYGAQLDVSDGSEVMVFMAFGDDANGYFRHVTYYTEVMNLGFPVMRGASSAVVQQTAETVVEQESVVPEQTAAEMQENVVSTTYTVQKGDSLCKIAKNVYGDERGYLDIYEANSDTIGTDYVIYTNQVLIIPNR